MSKDTGAGQRKQRLAVASWTIGIIVVAVLFLILAKAVSKPSTGDKAAGNGVASAALLAKLSGIPTGVFNSIGQGTSTPLPKAISAPHLTADGKPQVFYSGAEYCPYCATERWPMVIALLRFGSFTNLGTTHSASADVFPNTATFSFHGAKYTSSYLSFDAVETQSNQVQGNSYARLETPTPAQQALISTYDAAPYVPKESAGAIPFIDFGGQFIISGSTYAPSVLQDKSLDQIAAALSDKNSDIAKGAVGAANVITAVLCNLTGNQPASVCSNSMVQGLQAKLAAE